MAARLGGWITFGGDGAVSAIPWAHPASVSSLEPSHVQTHPAPFVALGDPTEAKCGESTQTAWHSSRTIPGLLCICGENRHERQQTPAWIQRQWRWPRSCPNFVSGSFQSLRAPYSPGLLAKPMTFGNRFPLAASSGPRFQSLSDNAKWFSPFILLPIKGSF